LIGLRAALDIIVPGKTLDAKRALKVGLVDAVVPVIALRNAAVKALAKAPQRKSSAWPPGFLVRAIARKRHWNRPTGITRPRCAPSRLPGGVRSGSPRAWRNGVNRDGQKSDTRVLSPGKVFKDESRRIAGEDPESWRARCGRHGCRDRAMVQRVRLTVRLKDIKPEFVAAGMKRIATTYREGVQRHKLTSCGTARAGARASDDRVFGLQDCDLVIEAVLESWQ